MSKWELPKEPQFYNWESPITKIYGDIHNEIIRQDEENCMCTIEQAIGYKVDKEELIKALQYDREQYDKGYKDGVKLILITELEELLNAMTERYRELYHTNDWHIGSAEMIKIVKKRISEIKEGDSK